MDLNINYQETPRKSIGYSAYQYFRSNKKPTIEIIFTKGKIELETEKVERINFYQESIHIIYKDNVIQFVNLNNITQIL